MKKAWMIKMESFLCPHNFTHTGAYYTCYHWKTKTRMCNQEDCPIKINEP